MLTVGLMLATLFVALTPPTTARAEAPGPKDTIAVMFSWTWNAIAEECTNTLGPAGYGYVQTSPPQEHVRGGEWWTYYQPVSYKLESRLGTEAEFKNMVDTCNDAGVGVIVDVVINHMSGKSGGGTGWAGTQFQHYNYPGLYNDGDFHDCRRDIDNYQDRWEVQNCNLVNLSDLDTGSASVQQKLADFMNRFVDMGAAGFRIDAVKHISADDMRGIMSKVKNRDQLYIVQEVIRANEPIQPEEYLGMGDIHEFAYARKIKEAFGGGTINWLISGNGIGETWDGFLKHSDAGVFVDNHDTERNGETLTYKNGDTYDLAQVFTLAWTYGSPSIQSGFRFSDYDAGPPQTGSGEVIDPTCTDESVWTCKHAQNDIANMVGFRVATYGTPVTDKWSNGSNAIAFSRGDKGTVAINRGGQFTRTFATGLPDGEYYNVISATNDGGTWSGDTITVSGGEFTATVPGNGAVAIHADAVAGPQCEDTQAPTTPKDVTATADGTRIAVTWAASTDDCGIAGYEITRTGGSGGTKTFTTSGTATSYTDTGLEADTEYTYSVRATDGAKHSAKSSAAKATTGSQPVTDDMTVYYKTDKNWEAYYAHYRVGDGAWTAAPGEKMTETCEGWVSLTVPSGADGATFAFNNGSGIWDNNGSKDYVVSGSDVSIASGSITNAAPCSQPTGDDMTVFYKTDKSWDAYYAHYRVGDGAWTAVPGEKMTEACEGWVSLTVPAGADGTTFVFNNGSGIWDNNASKDYVVSGAEVSIAGGSVSGDAPCAEPEPEAPTVPTDVRATADDAAVTVTWTASTAEAGIAEYTVSRIGGTTGTATYTVTETTFVDTAVSPDTTYTYTVTATSEEGAVSDASEPASVTTPAGSGGGDDTEAPSAPADLTGTATKDEITLTWSPSTDNVAVAGYRVVKSGNDEGTVGIKVDGTTIGFFDLATEATYTFRVQAVDAAGNESEWSEVSVTTSREGDDTAPSAPSDLEAEVDGTSVSLTWSASTDDAAVASYEVVKAGGGEETRSTSVTDTTHTYTGLTAQTDYTFKVRAVDTSGNTSEWSDVVTVTTEGTVDPDPDPEPENPGDPTGTDYSEGFYKQNPNGQVGRSATITVDGDASEWSDDMIIAQGIANDDPRIFRGSHEGPVYDPYALYGAWDDENVYLMWQFTNVTDVVDPGQGYPISDNGKPYNGDIPQAIAFDVTDRGGDGLVDGTDEGVWGMRYTFENNEVDHLALFSSKPGVGEPAMFSLNESDAFDYEEENVLGFTDGGIEFAHGDGFVGSSLMGIDANGYEGYTPADLMNTSMFIDFLNSSHDTAQDTIYEMKIPFSALGTTRAQVEENGIGVMLISTFGQSAVGSLPYDPATLDNATQPYTADDSTSAEKEDWDGFSAQFARLGK